MRHTIIATVLACFAFGMAHADTPAPMGSYAGALAGLTKVGSGCPSATDCDFRGKYTKLYAGTQVAPLWFVEVSLIDFGKAQFGSDAKATAHAIGLSLAYRQQVYKRLTLSTRLGLAYLQTNLKVSVPNKSEPDVITSQKLQPMLGVGAEVAITDLISAVASADFSRAKVASHSARLNTYGVGLSVNFDQQ